MTMTILISILGRLRSRRAVVVICGILFCSGVLVGFSACASASIIYDSGVNAKNINAFLTSQLTMPNEPSLNQQVANRFTTPATAEELFVTGINWWGGFLRNPLIGGSASFKIILYANDGDFVQPTGSGPADSNPAATALYVWNKALVVGRHTGVKVRGTNVYDLNP